MPTHDRDALRDTLVQTKHTKLEGQRDKMCVIALSFSLTEMR